MTTREDIKQLRNYLNSKESDIIPSDVKFVIDDLCSIYEMKYNL